MKRTARLTMLCLVVALTAGLLAPPAYASDDYPAELRDLSSPELDPWGFTVKQCTSFAAWRLNRNGFPMTNRMSGESFGDAHNWDDVAADLGFRVDNVPAVGAIAHWNSGEQGAGAMGHVAYVERVHTDGSQTIEEYNGAVKEGWSEEQVFAPRFIHFYDLSGTEPPQGAFASPAATSVPFGTELPLAAHVTDDTKLMEVKFYATSESGRRTLIASDPEPDGGTYTTSWIVDQQAGTTVALTASATDIDGNATTIEGPQITIVPLDSRLTARVTKKRAAVLVEGALEPGHYEGRPVTVVLSRKKDGTFRRVDAARSPLYGTYKARLRRPRPGTCKVTARFGGDWGLAASQTSQRFRC